MGIFKWIFLSVVLFFSVIAIIGSYLEQRKKYKKKRKERAIANMVKHYATSEDFETLMKD